MTSLQSLFPGQTNVKPYAALVTGVMAVSLAAIFIRQAQGEGMPSLVIAAGRLTLASLILTPFVLRNYQPNIRALSRRDFALTLTSGIFLALHFATWISSLEYTTVLVSVALVTTGPLWIALLEVAFLGLRPSKPLIVALLLAFIGGVVLAAPDSGNLQLGSDPIRGALLSVAGAIAVAFYLTIGRKIRAQLPVLPYIWIVYSCAAITLMIVVGITGLPLTGYTPSGYLWLILLGLIPQLVGHSSLNYALGYLPATFVSLSTQLEPALSAMIAAVVFGEIPTLLMVIGGAITLFGVTVASLNPLTTNADESQPKLKRSWRKRG